MKTATRILNEESFLNITANRLLIRCLVDGYVTDIIIFAEYDERIVQANYSAKYFSNLGHTKTMENRCGNFYKHQVRDVLSLWCDKKERPHGELWMPEEELIVVVTSRSEETRTITDIPIFLYSHFGRIQEGLQKVSYNDNNGSTREPARLVLKRLEGFLDEHCGNVQAAAAKIAELVQYK